MKQPEPPRRRNWFSKIQLCAQSLWLSPEWVQSRDAVNHEEWGVELSAARFEAMWAFAKWHDGLCFWPSATANHTDEDYFGQTVNTAEKNGLKVLAYLSVGLDDLAARTYPGWKSVDRRGLPCYGVYGFDFNCLNSPYGDYVRAQLQELIDGYAIDGLWLDFIYFPPHGCYCVHCDDRYRRKYGKRIRDSDVASMTTFQSETVYEFLHSVKHSLTSKHPGAIVGYNGAGSWLNPAYLKVEDLADFGVREGHSIPVISWGGKLLRTQDKPFEIVISGCIREQWQQWALKPPSLLKVEAAFVCAHGGVPDVSFNPTPNGKVHPAEWQNLKSVGDWLHERRAIFARSESASDVALIALPEQLVSVGPYDRVGAPKFSQEFVQEWHDDSAWISIRRQRFNVPGAAERHAFDSNLVGYLRALDETHVSTDIIRTADADTLRKYRAVLLNGPLSDALVADLRRYVEKGGVALVTGTTLSPADIRPDVEELFGVRIGSRGPADTCYIAPTAALRTGLPDYPVLFTSTNVEVEATTAEVVATFVYPESPWSWHMMAGSDWNAPGDNTRIPAITVNRLGEGRAIWLGVDAGAHVGTWGDNEPWSKALVGRLVRSYIPGGLLIEILEGPPGLRIVASRRENQYVFHLVNLYSTFKESLGSHGGPPLTNIRARLRRSSVGDQPNISLAPSGAPVVSKASGDFVEIVVPEVDLHTAVVVVPK